VSSQAPPGTRILRASVAGVRAPRTLAAFCHDRCQKHTDESALALTGTWREAPLFVRPQALALCDCSTAQSRACLVITLRFAATPWDCSVSQTLPRAEVCAAASGQARFHACACLLGQPIGRAVSEERCVRRGWALTCPQASYCSGCSRFSLWSISMT
jgi:hypothetical protein